MLLTGKFHRTRELFDTHSNAACSPTVSYYLISKTTYGYKSYFYGGKINEESGSTDLYGINTL